MREMLLNCPVDVLTMAETLELVHDSMRNRQRLQHVALNVAKFVNMRRDPVLEKDVVSSDLVGIDGMGIVLAGRLLGIPVQERVTGIDLLNKILTLCAEKGFRPYFLGATPEIVSKAVRETLNKHPAICFAGSRDGYFKPEEEFEVVSKIRDSGADCLFIGMPTPRKERFLARHRDSLNVPFIMGVGGSFDIIAGLVRRAPTLMQAHGFEWLYRVYQEPRRMWWRYAKTNVLFAGILVRAVVQHLQSSFSADRTTKTGSVRVRT